MRDSHDQYFQFLRQQIAILQRRDATPNEEIDWQEIQAVLGDLQATYGQLQASLEAAEDVGEAIFQQREDYFDLFHLSPIAYLVTDANGLILEANQAIATLLNVSCIALVGRSLAMFVAEGDRSVLQTHLTGLSQQIGTQICYLSLCPRQGEPVVAELHLAIARNPTGQIEQLRIGVYNLSQFQANTAALLANRATAPLQPQVDVVSTGLPISQLPRSLDGLQVLFVDDEADIREFVTAVLETHGIGVRTVASAAAAIAELERFRPDVLLSDIRLPDEDGYSLIRRVRALEAQQGGHLPAAAITAYLDEDREKAIAAGFEAHLHKLVQPDQWVEMVAQLANQAARREQDL